MSSLAVELDGSEIRRLMASLKNPAKSTPKILAAAVNDTARQTRTRMSVRIRRRVNIKKKDLDPYLSFSKATTANPQSKITLKEERRISLKDFGAKQTKRGVTYKIDKLGGRKLVPGAFGPQIGKLNSLPTMRVGKKRFPIRFLRGVSAWGVFVQNKSIEQGTLDEARKLLANNIRRRVNLELLRESGKVKRGRYG